jgi:glycosyltransferase involved in cell wall biosynthesis
MRVCYVFQDQYPWDVRAEKILTSLAAHGIDAHVIARNRQRQPLYEQLHPRVHVHRLPRPRHAFVRDLVNFPAFFSPVWLIRILQVTRQVDAALIIVRDLPLAPAALMIGRMTGRPVVMDMAENYPAMLQDTWTHRGPGPVDFLIRNPRVLKWLEGVVVRRLDGILVVSRLSGDRVAALGVAPDRIHVVSNTPRIGTASVTPRGDASEFRLLYVGGMEESRGLEIVVRALALIAERIPGARFVIAGRGSTEAALQQLAESLGVGNRVEFTGWISPDQVPALIGSADVCIVPHFVTQHTQTTVPNKIFDYMWQERPVIVTDALALRDIVESSGCGLVYHDTDPASLAGAIVRLSDPALRRELGAAGRRAVLDRYNWAVDERILLDVVARLGAGRAPVKH